MAGQHWVEAIGAGSRTCQVQRRGSGLEARAASGRIPVFSVEVVVYIPLMTETIQRRSAGERPGRGEPIHGPELLLRGWREPYSRIRYAMLCASVVRGAVAASAETKERRRPDDGNAKEK